MEEQPMNMLLTSKFSTWDASSAGNSCTNQTSSYVTVTRNYNYIWDFQSEETYQAPENGTQKIPIARIDSQWLKMGGVLTGLQSREDAQPSGRVGMDVWKRQP